MAAFSSDDVLITDARILYSATGVALPDETTVAWNDSSGAYTNWTNWTLLGYTTEPSQMSYSYEVFEVDVQQSTSPIKRSKTDETFTVTTTLAQFDGDILALLFGGTNTATAAGASQKGFDQVVAGGSTSLSEYQFALEGYRLDTANTKQPVRVFIYRATIRQNGDISFDKGGVAGMPIIIEGLADASKSVGAQLIEMHIVTAPATS